MTIFNQYTKSLFPKIPCVNKILQVQHIKKNDKQGRRFKAKTSIKL